jgi:hypothetical protein
VGVVGNVDPRVSAANQHQASEDRRCDPRAHGSRNVVSRETLRTGCSARASLLVRSGSEAVYARRPLLGRS